MVWKVDGSLGLQNLDIIRIDETLGNYRVCMMDCEDETVTDSDVAANARLIAAAPDMYTALEGLIWNYAHFGRVPDTFVAEVSKLLQEIDG